LLCSPVPLRCGYPLSFDSYPALSLTQVMIRTLLCKADIPTVSLITMTIATMGSTALCQPCLRVSRHGRRTSHLFFSPFPVIAAVLAHTRISKWQPQVSVSKVERISTAAIHVDRMAREMTAPTLLKPHPSTR